MDDDVDDVDVDDVDVDEYTDRAAALFSLTLPLMPKPLMLITDSIIIRTIMLCLTCVIVVVIIIIAMLVVVIVVDGYLEYQYQA